MQRYFLKGGTENTKFIYDGQDVLVDDNSGTLTKYQNGSGIDNKLKVSLNGTAKYFLADHLGSTNGLTNASGNLTESANYDSFGNATGNLNTRYQFTGREFDNFTGLHYYRARFYDAPVGRFISEDPIGLSGGINQFGYVGNNPQGFTDPSGLIPTGSEAADWMDERINYAQDSYGFDPTIGYLTIPGQTPSPIKVFELSRGFSDMFRVGNGLACALADNDENIWGRAAYIATDINRAANLFTTLASPFAKAPVVDKWSRSPKSLQDAMTLEAAQNGAGGRIISNLGDSRFKGMEKWEYKVKSTDGLDSVVHYVKDPKTGKLMDFKFTKHSTDGFGIWGITKEPKAFEGTPPSWWKK